jgi:hypothetical protein
MAQKSRKEMKKNEIELLINVLKPRFQKNMHRHKDVLWENVEKKLWNKPEKIWALNKMEETGGEPDLVAYEKTSDDYIFFDCSLETPKNRRSLCYDKEALDTRKEFKPINSAIDLANEMDIEMLTEEDYRYLQTLGKYDTKTSSWIKTPEEVRKLGGAMFADFRYGRVFVYHNGAQSYYGSRAFRGKLRI